jgi:hypothetical protein
VSLGFVRADFTVPEGLAAEEQERRGMTALGELHRAAARRGGHPGAVGLTVTGEQHILTAVVIECAYCARSVT